MELVTQNTNDEIKNLFETQVSVHPVAWRALHFYWKGAGHSNLVDLKNALSQFMTDDLDSAFIFPWGEEDIFVLCRGVRYEPLQKAVQTIDKKYREAHPSLEEDAEYKISVYDLSIAWGEFKEFFHFREKEIAKQEADFSESIAREEAEIKTVYEEPKPNPMLIRERDERPGITVLVVEDDEPTLKMMASILKQYKVERAKDGREALDKFFETAPDVVFLDIQIPHFNGWEIMERIHKADPKAFVILVTAHAQEDDVQKAIQLGVKGYIKKPFSQQKLIQYVEKFSETAPKHKQVKAIW